MILGDLPQFFKCRVVASSKILTRAEEVPELVLFALEARTGAAVDARDHVEHVGWMMGLRCPEETAFSILTKNFHVRRHCCSRLRPGHPVIYLFLRISYHHPCHNCSLSSCKSMCQTGRRSPPQSVSSP